VRAVRKLPSCDAVFALIEVGISQCRGCAPSVPPSSLYLFNRCIDGERLSNRAGHHWQAAEVKGLDTEAWQSGSRDGKEMHIYGAYAAQEKIGADWPVYGT